MKTRLHSHPCAHCQTPVECCGTLSQNWDGFPDAICDQFHLPGGEIAHVLCEDCDRALCPVCKTNERPIAEVQRYPTSTVTLRWLRCDDCRDGDASA